MDYSIFMSGRSNVGQTSTTNQTRASMLQPIGQSALRTEDKMRILLWAVFIIFLVGLAVVTGVFKLLIPG